MDKKIDISVILPVYRKTDLLTRAIDSVLAQKGVSIELIVIDDGSENIEPDFWDKLLKQYSAYNLRFQKLLRNAGVHEARRQGACLAKGEWIGFIDADDVALPRLYKTMIVRGTNDRADIVVCGYSTLSAGRVVSNLVFLNDELVSKNLMHRFSKLEFGTGAMWNKLYRSSFFLQYGNQSLSRRLDTHEDMLVNIECFRHAQRLSIVNELLYCYTKDDPDSVTLRRDEVRTLVDHFKAYALAVERLSSAPSADRKNVNRLFHQTFRMRRVTSRGAEALIGYDEELSDYMRIIGGSSPSMLLQFINMSSSISPVSLKDNFNRLKSDFRDLPISVYNALKRRIKIFR